MRLPQLTDEYTTREVTAAFSGYNHNLIIADGEFHDLEGVSLDDYPAIGSRGPRGKVRPIADVNGIHAHERLAWVSGTRFYYNGASNTGWTVTDGPKQFANMGSFILIWPDAKYYNTVTGEFGALGASFTTTAAVSYALAKGDGTTYTDYHVGDSAPQPGGDEEDLPNGTLWLDTSATPHVLKQYSAYSAAWVAIPTTYVRIASAGIGAQFKKYDGVTISGTKNGQFDGSFVLYDVQDDSIVIAGMLDTAFNQTEAVTIARTVPEMDFVTECENRLWGCSSANHEIYACKLGDPFNWNCFMGLSTDSYALTIGTDGDFTGACTYLGYVLFFKEDYIHKVYGNKPANYQAMVSAVRGVERGSEHSLVINNETLYYKARGGFMRYTGSVPEPISPQLGDVVYRNAVAGSFNNKYVVSMEGPEGYELFAYDEARGAWLRDGSMQVDCFARLGGDLYAISGGYLWSFAGNIANYLDANHPPALVYPERFVLDTGNLGLQYPDHRYVTRLVLRFALEPAYDGDAPELTVSTYYDGATIPARSIHYAGARRGITALPIIPERRDQVRIRLEGRGAFRLYAIAKTMETGSEV